MKLPITDYYIFSIQLKLIIIIFEITNHIQIVVHLVYILFCLVSTYCSTVCINNLHQDSQDLQPGEDQTDPTEADDTVGEESDTIQEMSTH